MYFIFATFFYIPYQTDGYSSIIYVILIIHNIFLLIRRTYRLSSSIMATCISAERYGAEFCFIATRSHSEFLL